MDALLDNFELVLTNHETFFAIAHEHYQKVLDLVAERDAHEIITDADADFDAQKNAEIQRAAMATVVFSALTLEAFINWYGMEKFSKSFVDDHLDKLPTKSKWLIIPWLATGKKIPTDGQAYEGIVIAFGLRDAIVHYKAKKKRVKELTEEEDWVTEEHAGVAYKAVGLAANALKALDAPLDVEWLDEAKDDPYV